MGRFKLANAYLSKDFNILNMLNGYAFANFENVMLL